MPAICASLEISRLLTSTLRSYGVLINRRSVRIGVTSIGLKPDVALADAAREVLRRGERIVHAAGLQDEADARPAGAERVEER